LPAPNSKGTDGPFATVSRAQTAVQGILQNPKGRTTPIHVMVRAGSFYVTQPLSFTTADSGTSTLQVVWENYPNETPVISGGMRITNWTHGSGNEWQATLPSSVHILSSYFTTGSGVCDRAWVALWARITESQRRSIYLVRPRVRRPTPTARSICPAWDGSASIVFQYTATDPISSSWTNLNSPYPQGDIELYDFEKWTVPKLRIKSIDTASNIVYLTGPTDQQDFYHGFMVGHRYVVENIKNELTQPGQWFLDRSKTPWTLTYLANTGENPPTDTVIVPQSTQVLVATGLQWVNVPGITFEHDNWTFPPWDTHP